VPVPGLKQVKACVSPVGSPRHDVRMKDFRTAFVLLLLLPGLLSCDSRGDSTRTAPPFSVVDSAGVTIAHTSRVGLETLTAWHVDSIPNVVIGDEHSMIIHRVQGLKSLPDGGIVFVNAGEQELLFFDSDGQLLKRSGGAGEGPGEFRDPVLVPWLTSDSLLLFDKGLPRLQVLTSDGIAVRTIAFRRWPAGRVPPEGALATDTLLIRSGRLEHGEGAAVAEGPHQRVEEYLWHDPLRLNDVAVDSFYFGFTHRSRGRLWTQPFRYRPSATVTRSGALTISGREPEVREYDRSGQLRRIIRADQPASKVTREMIATVVRDDLPKDVPIPETLPFFGATGVWSNGSREATLVVDELGWLWVQLYTWDRSRPRKWLIFDPEGRARTTAQTPSSLQVIAIQQDQIWGIWRGAFNVESVRRFSLRREQQSDSP
jgi:hypothetical protein